MTSFFRKTRQSARPGAAIEVQKAVKRFGSFTAVDDISFSVGEGEVFGLLGPNGAGKSTLIRMMTTLIPLTGGSIWINGYNVAEDADSVRRSMGVIPQALTSDGDLTVGENLSIYAKLYGIGRAERERNIDRLLEAVNLSAWRDAPVRTLSGGMRRRVEIARGLVHSPKVFFLDEPTTGLDPVSRVAVWEMLQKIRESHRLTVLVTTHYMDEADHLCDRIAIVDHGHLVALDTPLALKHGVPGTNVIETQFSGAPEDWAAELGRLPSVENVEHTGGEAYRLMTGDGSATTVALVESARRSGVAIKTLSVQNTTLDDVFVHYTGRQLRDETVKPDVYRQPVKE
jgi:ABC-2 type transport system ATP-binding protein